MKVKEESGKSGLKLNIKNKFKKLGSWHLIPSLHGNRRGKSGSSDILFSWAPKSLWTVNATMKLKDTYSLEEQL